LSNALVIANVFEVTDALSVAAEPTRRKLLQMLASGPRTVSELASHFPVTRSAISQHLGALAEVGLVTNRKEGRQRFYSVLPEGMAELRAEIDKFWTTELDRLVEDAAALAARRGRSIKADSQRKQP
jgi:DNA-binding transcriptional ArsR family regulator